MDEMHSFLRTITENPEDDNPRLVFSDWLEENGHQDRAEFIRLQIELANMDPGEDGYAGKTARMYRTGMFTNKATMPFFDHVPNKEWKIGFRRGFIETIYDDQTRPIDDSGFDFVPLLALRTGSKLIDTFKRFTKLKWLELYGYIGLEESPEKLLEVLGPNGWFQHLEDLSLTNLSSACLQAGVIPQFDLPKLRNLYLYTDPFHGMGAPSASDSGQWEVEYGDTPWDRLPEYLPKNALPNPEIALERFVWHSDDDSDFYPNGDWFWPGPGMDSLLVNLNPSRLKHVEVVVDHDDHEIGGEGIIAAPYQQNPLELSPKLEHITIGAEDLQRITDSPQKLKSLRIYDAYGSSDPLFTLLNQPVCSELESLVIANRGGGWGKPQVDPSINFTNLKSLYLAGIPLERFANCSFPNLISLSGYNDIKIVLERQWPKLQCFTLWINRDYLSELKAFAKSDSFPNLTTLTILGYFKPEETDFSFLANSPHMPHLGLIRIPDYPMKRNYIVDKGQFHLVRSDVLMTQLAPISPYNFTTNVF